MAKSRGVRGAAGFCAVASLVYLLVRSLLYALVSTLMGLAHPGASMAKPLGFSEVSLALFQLIIGLTLVFMMKLTRLRSDDLRLTLPAPWSPGFCLPVFLGVANLANLAGALINHITGSETTAQMLPSSGPELFMYYLALCVMPAVAEELLFRGAFQGLMRPSGSAAAIFAPALLFGLLHLDLAQGFCLRRVPGLAGRALGQHFTGNAAASGEQHTGIFDDVSSVLCPDGGILRRRAVPAAFLPAFRAVDDLARAGAGVPLFGGIAARRGCADGLYQPGIQRSCGFPGGLCGDFCTLRGNYV